MIIRKILLLSVALLICGVATAGAQEPEETTTTTEVIICQEVMIPEVTCQHIPEESPVASFIESTRETSTTEPSQDIPPVVTTVEQTEVGRTNVLARTGMNEMLAMVGVALILVGRTLCGFVKAF